jgi:hypothetical protein
VSAFTQYFLSYLTRILAGSSHSCSNCPLLFATKHDLQVHKRSVHQESTTAHFGDGSSVTVWRNHDTLNFSCPNDCGYLSNVPINLSRHVATHQSPSLAPPILHPAPLPVLPIDSQSWQEIGKHYPDGYLLSMLSRPLTEPLMVSIRTLAESYYDQFLFQSMEISPWQPLVGKFTPQCAVVSPDFIGTAVSFLGLVLYHHKETSLLQITFPPELSKSIDGFFSELSSPNPSSLSSYFHKMLYQLFTDPSPSSPFYLFLVGSCLRVDNTTIHPKQIYSCVSRLCSLLRITAVMDIRCCIKEGSTSER